VAEHDLAPGDRVVHGVNAQSRTCSASARWASAMENPKVPWSARITAAGMIADRAFGRAPQSVSLNMTRRLNELSISELRALEAKLAGEERLIDLSPAETPSATDS
jgi:hypothetical protein